EIKIYFSDFSSDFSIRDDIFYRWLASRYTLIIDPIKPDYLVYSCYGTDYLKYNDCIRIFYTAENIRPDFNVCDYAIGFDFMEYGDRYYRFPNYARYGEQFELLTSPRSYASNLITQKKGFCNFIYSNSFADPARDEFFHLLSRYKKVDSLGAHLKNTEIPISERYAKDWRTSKVEIQKEYKFSITFENSFAPGYTTEKMLHALISNTIPIYWGNPLVDRDFNPNCFINCHHFKSWNDVVETVIEIDSNQERYLEMINQPPFVNNQVPENLKNETLVQFFANVFEQPLDKAFRRPQYGTTSMYERKINNLVELERRFNWMNQFINKLKRYV
ncbi:MAG: glycosyltransferase, partial [Candidatus Marinimicrobia bacterium]|nr:glycosyltransferase [Candidatus Neomarinimicrobiota bacterium]